MEKNRKNIPPAVENEQTNEFVKQQFEEAQELDWGGDKQAEDLAEHTDESPKLSGGDIDADWQRADDVGEEAVGGTVATPDQSRVEEEGQALGISYSDTEPLHTADKLDQRDRKRYELDPASDPEFRERVQREFDDPLAPEENKK